MNICRTRQQLGMGLARRDPGSHERHADNTGTYRGHKGSPRGVIGHGRRRAPWHGAAEMGGCR